MKKLIHRIAERQSKVCISQLQYSIKKINRKIQKSKIAFKNKKVTTASNLKIIMVQEVFSFVIVLRQDEFDTYHTTFYPICISG